MKHKIVWMLILVLTTMLLGVFSTVNAEELAGGYILPVLTTHPTAKVAYIAEDGIAHDWDTIEIQSSLRGDMFNYLPEAKLPEKSTALILTYQNSEGKDEMRMTIPNTQLEYEELGFFYLEMLNDKLRDEVILSDLTGVEFCRIEMLSPFATSSSSIAYWGPTDGVTALLRKQFTEVWQEDTYTVDFENDEPIVSPSSFYVSSYLLGDKASIGSYTKRKIVPADVASGKLESELPPEGESVKIRVTVPEAQLYFNSELTDSQGEGAIFPEGAGLTAERIGQAWHILYSGEEAELFPDDYLSVDDADWY